MSAVLAILREGYLFCKIPAELSWYSYLNWSPEVYFYKIAKYLYDRDFPDVDEKLENEEEEYSPQLPEHARLRERGVQARRHIKAIIDKLAESFKEKSAMC